VDDRELVAVVLEEPELRIDLELEPIRRRSGVAARFVPLGDPVAENE
jgi:hypothetical protein